MNAHIAFTRFSGKRLQLGVCGSIAAYKALDLMRHCQKAGFDVGVTLTDAATRFIAPLSFEALGASPVYTSLFRHAGSSDGDVFGHLEPGASSDVFAIVAASANTMARLAHGLADEILSCQALAFPLPLVIAPAMNPRMWANTATQANCEILRQRGHVIVEPEYGPVACNDTGQGRLASLDSIYLAILKAACPQDLACKTVLVTLGPTREHWDGVRFWSNPSTGTMGAALAVAAYLRGATVHAVCGPGSFAGQPWLPEGIQRHPVTSAKEMFEAASALWPACHIGAFTAAVADFAPVPFGTEKFKKATAGDSLRIEFTANPDILLTLSQQRAPGQRIIGFAAETGDLERHVREKLARKKADLLVGNLVGGAGSGFASATNTVFIADASGKSAWLPTMPKADLAWRILDWLLHP